MRMSAPRTPPAHADPAHDERKAENPVHDRRHSGEVLDVDLDQPVPPAGAIRVLLEVDRREHADGHGEQEHEKAQVEGGEDSRPRARLLGDRGRETASSSCHLSAGHPVMSVSTSNTARVPKATTIENSMATLKSRFFQARPLRCASEACCSIVVIRRSRGYLRTSLIETRFMTRRDHEQRRARRRRSSCTRWSRSARPRSRSRR